MTTKQIQREIEGIFAKFSLSDRLHGSLEVTTPLTGANVGSLESTRLEAVDVMIRTACAAQPRWTELGIATRGNFLLRLAESVAKHVDDLAKLVHYDSGKSVRESKGEVLSTVALIKSVVAASGYDPLPSGAERSKEYTPLGLIAVISPFNFPLAIGMWSGVPALLAGNVVINKPSEHACLASIVYEAIFKQAVQTYNASGSVAAIPENIFQVAIGGPEVGRKLVADERVAKVVFTGSIAGCEAVKAVDAQLPDRDFALTEGGAANFAVYSNRHDGMTRPEFVDFIVGATMKSFLPYAGQKCVNTRLVAVHADLFDEVVQRFRETVSQFANSWKLELASSEDNPFEFTPLINRQAVQRFDWARQQAIEQGGELIGGERAVADEESRSHFVTPTIAVFKERVPLMNEEIFGPFLMLVPYTGDVHGALAVAQQPNANLVNAYFGSGEAEINAFKRLNTAGFTLINPPLGTGLLPPYGLGFGGNGLSGQGESLPRDPLLPFVRPDGAIKRTVTFKLPTSASQF